MSTRWKAAVLALGIGVFTVFGSWLAITIPFGDPLATSGEDWLGLLILTAVTALPFLALALLRERSPGLWGSALAVTFLLWGYFVVEAISYRKEGSSVLAHMGFDFVLFFYPFVLTATLVAISLFRKAWAR
jgi:hypothetical protein